jgi:predicted AlkP superfamily phosphohydrolase/phosphomutase
MENYVGDSAMFTVIGFDGASPEFLLKHQDDLPTFKLLIDCYGLGILKSPYNPIRSATAWTTIFTGISPKKHGVVDFISNQKLFRRKDVPATFVWELLEDKGLKVAALNIVALLPPINYNCDMMEWVPQNLSITEEEMSNSSKTLTEKSIELLDSGLDFFAVVYPSIDRASHLFWGTEKVLTRYKAADNALASLLEHIKGDFMIVSDHGFQSMEQAVIQGCEDQLDRSRTGGHHPEGIVICNFAGRPKELIEVTPTIYRRLL